MSTIGPQTATLANVTASASSVVLFTAVASSRCRIIFNDADQALYVAFAGTASLTAFTYKIDAGATREITNYSGVVSGIWAGAPTGAARTTRF